MSIEQLKALLAETAVMVPVNEDEAMKVDYVTETEVYCTGVDSGNEYAIGFDTINVDDYVFYRYTAIDLTTFTSAE
jgi:hypothetical protein